MIVLHIVKVQKRTTALCYPNEYNAKRKFRQKKWHTQQRTWNNQINKYNETKVNEPSDLYEK